MCISWITSAETALNDPVSSPESRRSSGTSLPAAVGGPTGSKRQQGSTPSGQPNKKVSRITIDDDGNVLVLRGRSVHLPLAWKEWKLPTTTACTSGGGEEGGSHNSMEGEGGGGGGEKGKCHTGGGGGGGEMLLLGGGKRGGGGGGGGGAGREVVGGGGGGGDGEGNVVLWGEEQEACCTLGREKKRSLLHCIRCSHRSLYY